MDSIAIHCNAAIAWQAERAPQFLQGLKALGLPAHITTNRQRESEHAILLGTTFWRSIEATGSFLLVDRASYNDPDYVQLVWNGHGRRGDHKVPAKIGHRAEQTVVQTIHPWNKDGKRVVICGQTESYSPRWRCLRDWYSAIPNATHFRKHPAGENPTRLPNATDWGDVGLVITLNSSVAIEAVLNGIPTVTMDEGSMAWEVTGHAPDVRITPYRYDWLEWLAWTQWSWREIEAGAPIRHLFEEL